VSPWRAALDRERAAGCHLSRDAGAVLPVGLRRDDKRKRTHDLRGRPRNRNALVTRVPRARYQTLHGADASAAPAGIAHQLEEALS
jgi:hypothetical protein